MRIAFLTSAFSFGGAQMSSVELAARLGSRYDIKFFDTNGSSEPFIKSLLDNKIDYTLLSESSSPFIIKKYSFKLFNIFRYFIYIFKWLRTRKRVHTEMRKFQPEIVMVYDDRSLSYLAAFNKKSFETIYYARGWYSPDQIPAKMRYVLKRMTDKLICVSESTRQALYCGSGYPLEKMYVVHNAIDTDILSGQIEPVKGNDDDFKIVHSGGFLPSKGQHIALEAAQQLKERMENFHLYLCGIIYPGLGNKSQNYIEELKQFVVSNKLESKVTFVVGKSNIISYINHCDIMFFPSSTEGLPRSVMEAMALGKPVIANAVGGITDLILDRYTGMITDYNDSNQYAEYAVMLSNNVILYQEIAQNARSLIEKSFSGTLQIERIEKIFKNMHDE
jgi:glycosyltransferase involved in cell wall biosynthesis